LARFVSADTLVPSAGNPQAFNRYSHTSNNPLKYIDPSGHFPIIPFLIAAAVLMTVAGCAPPPATPPVVDPYATDTKYYYSEQYGWFDRNHFSDHGVIGKVGNAVDQGGGKIVLDESQTLDLKLEKSYWVSGNITEDQIPGVSEAIFMDFQSGWEAWQGENGEFTSSYAVDDLPSNTLAFIAEWKGTTPEALLDELEAYPTYYSPPLPGSATARFKPMRLNLDTGGYEETNWPWSLPEPINDPTLWYALRAIKTPPSGVNILVGGPKYYYYNSETR
jgi:hypothetical protein